MTDQDEITTNGVPEELITSELEKVQQSPEKKDIADTGLVSGPVLSASECTGTVNRDAASSLLLDLVGAHPISVQNLPDSESTRSGIRGTPAGVLSDIMSTSMISEPVPPESDSSTSILTATAPNLQDSSDTGPTSVPSPPASESAKSIRKGTPSSLLSRRSKSKSISSLSIQTGISKEKARLEEISWDLFEKSGAKEVELENDGIFESDKENMTPADSCGTRNKAGQKAVCTMGETKQHIGAAMNSSSKLATQVFVRKGVKKSAETLCIPGKSNLNSGSVSLNSRLSEAKENESCTSTKEKVIPKLFASRSGKKSRRTVHILGEMNQVGWSSSKVLHEKENSSSVKQNGTLPVSVRKSAKKSEKTVHAVGETIQVAQSAAQVLLENYEGNENFASDKENATPISSSTESSYRPVSKRPGRALFQDVDFEGIEKENCENFASDKENCTPDSKLAQKLRQPLFEGHPVVDTEIGERKESERVPFQILFDNNVQVPCNSPLKPLCTIPDNSSVVSSFSQSRISEPTFSPSILYFVVFWVFKFICMLYHSMHSS